MVDKVGTLPTLTTESCDENSEKTISTKKIMRMYSNKLLDIVTKTYLNQENLMLFLSVRPLEFYFSFC